ncbi:MAG: hypothetical protein ABW008_05340, partial [Acidimicrobiales bacterium]
MEPGRLVDLNRYPLDDPDLVAAGRADLAADGVTTLPGFLRPGAVAEIVAEVEGLAGHFSDVKGTPYLALPDESVEEGHPRRVHSRSALSAIAYDRFP